jgi:hypothetical protein
MFFVFSPHEVAEDTRYIQERYFPHVLCPDGAPTKVTRLKQQRVILALYNYRHCGPRNASNWRRKRGKRRCSAVNPSMCSVNSCII